MHLFWLEMSIHRFSWGHGPVMTRCWMPPDAGAHDEMCGYKEQYPQLSSDVGVFLQKVAHQ